MYWDSHLTTSYLTTDGSQNGQQEPSSSSVLYSLGSSMISPVKGWIFTLKVTFPVVKPKMSTGSASTLATQAG